MCYLKIALSMCDLMLVEVLIPAILPRDLTPHPIIQPHLSRGSNLDIASKLLSIGGSTKAVMGIFRIREGHLFVCIYNSVGFNIRLKDIVCVCSHKTDGIHISMLSYPSLLKRSNRTEISVSRRILAVSWVIISSLAKRKRLYHII